LSKAYRLFEPDFDLDPNAAAAVADGINAFIVFH
jgi:hypothetical protein